jgi:hypothetical protein
LEFIIVSRLDEVLKAALEREPQPSQEWVERMAAQEAAATQTN